MEPFSFEVGGHDDNNSCNNGLVGALRAKLSGDIKTKASSSSSSSLLKPSPIVIWSSVDATERSSIPSNSNNAMKSKRVIDSLEHVDGEAWQSERENHEGCGNGFLGDAVNLGCRASSFPSYLWTFSAFDDLTCSNHHGSSNTTGNNSNINSGQMNEVRLQENEIGGTSWSSGQSFDFESVTHEKQLVHCDNHGTWFSSGGSWDPLFYASSGELG